MRRARCKGQLLTGSLIALVIAVATLGTAMVFSSENPPVYASTLRSSIHHLALSHSPTGTKAPGGAAQAVQRSDQSENGTNEQAASSGHGSAVKRR